LLPGEGFQFGSFHPTGFQPFQVRMPENPILKRLELVTDLVD
jgi:hypothetical protein